MLLDTRIPIARRLAVNTEPRTEPLELPQHETISQPGDTAPGATLDIEIVEVPPQLQDAPAALAEVFPCK
jgi:hypothetical protein